MKYIKILLLCFLTLNIAAEDIKSEEIYSLLNDIEKKTDLSAKTKLENGGISFIYTRDDLQRMQINNLNDILKATYPFGYNENKYGRPDPLTFTTYAPFLSSMIRVFIDNQEITTGLYGSGIVVLGDIDLGFVDHIEIYTQNPSYEFSTEATFILVKLYTKVAQKDEGGKVKASSGSYGTKGVSGYYSSELNDEWSHFNYISGNDLKRKKHDSHGTSLSRDQKRTHILSSLYTQDQRVLLQAIRSSEDAFIGKSFDATPLENRFDMDFLHLGYDTKKNNLSFLISYDYMYTDTYFRDDQVQRSSIDTELRSHIYSTELKYANETPKNKLVTGVKYRLKTYNYDKRVVNGSVQADPDSDKQTTGTVFVENQYSLKENSIITTGASYSKVRNNHSEQNDELFMYRVGHTYTTQSNWIFKTVGSHVEMSIDPYLVNNSGSYIVTGEIDVQSMDSIIENIIYEPDNNKYELMLTSLKTKRFLVPNSQGQLYNYDKNLYTRAIITKWTHNYNEYDKFFVTLEYAKKYNLPQIGDQTIKKVILRNLNTYNKFDIFNEMIFYEDDTDRKEFYDYSAGIKYHYSRDLSISFKGINLLDKAKTTTYARINPATMTAEQPLKISPIDRSLLFSLEYLF